MIKQRERRKSTGKENEASDSCPFPLPQHHSLVKLLFLINENNLNPTHSKHDRHMEQAKL